MLEILQLSRGMPGYFLNYRSIPIRLFPDLHTESSLCFHDPKWVSYKKTPLCHISPHTCHTCKPKWPYLSFTRLLKQLLFFLTNQTTSVVSIGTSGYNQMNWFLPDDLINTGGKHHIINHVLQNCSLSLNRQAHIGSDIHTWGTQTHTHTQQKKTMSMHGQDNLCVFF